MDQQEPKTQDASPTPDRDEGKELIDELARLSQRFVEAVEVAWSSDQRKAIQDDLRAGLSSLAELLERGLHDIGEKEQTKQFVGKAEEVAGSVAERIRTSQTAHELAAGLAGGLRAVNDKLEELIADMRTREPKSGDAPAHATESPLDTPSQDIPIEPT